MLLKTISAKHSKVTKLIQASVKMTQYIYEMFFEYHRNITPPYSTTSQLVHFRDDITQNNQVSKILIDSFVVLISGSMSLMCN